MNKVIDFRPPRKATGQRVILRGKPDGWSLAWAASAGGEEMCFGALALREPAEVAARAIAARYGCEFVVEEGPQA